MKKKKTRSPILVSVSAFAMTGLFAPSCWAQVVINCSQDLSIGKNAQCSDTIKFVINPDGSTNLVSGCIVNTTPPIAGKCVIKTGGVLPTKNVRVDFDKTFISLKNGGKSVKLDDFLMQYKTTVPAATKFTFTPTAIANTVTMRIGATVNTTTSISLGSYSGTITVRANPI